MSVIFSTNKGLFAARPHSMCNHRANHKFMYTSNTCTTATQPTARTMQTVHVNSAILFTMTIPFRGHSRHATVLPEHTFFIYAFQAYFQAHEAHVSQHWPLPLLLYDRPHQFCYRAHSPPASNQLFLHAAMHFPDSILGILPNFVSLPTIHPALAPPLRPYL